MERNIFILSLLKAAAASLDSVLEASPVRHPARRRQVILLVTVLSDVELTGVPTPNRVK
jgi:hypothetical protein